MRGHSLCHRVRDCKGTADAKCAPGVRPEWNIFIGIFENRERKKREIHAKTRE